jgi:adenosine deaminase
MNNEYIQLHRNMGFTLEELFRVSMDSIETSFLQEDEKMRLRKMFTRGFEALPRP